MANLSEADRKRLKKNPNVSKVTAKNVTYTSAFKVNAVQRYFSGDTYETIFSDAGINLSLFEDQYARKAVERWRKIFAKSGAEGFEKERRGIGATGRPKGKMFKSIEAEVAYLRAENDFLKKLRALEATYLKKKNSR